MTPWDVFFGGLLWSIMLSGLIDFYRWFRLYRAVRRIERRSGTHMVYLVSEIHRNR